MKFTPISMRRRRQVKHDEVLPEQTPVAELDLSARTINALEDAGLICMGDLTVKTRDELLQIPDFGVKGLQETVVAMKIMGLTAPKAWTLKKKKRSARKRRKQS